MIFHADNSNINIRNSSLEELILLIKKENPGFWNLFKESGDEEQIREEIYKYIYNFEIHCIQSYHMDTIQRHYSQQAIRVLKNLFSSRNERVTHFSVLSSIKKCTDGNYSDVSLGLLYEILFLFRALKGTSGIEHNLYDKETKIKSELSRHDIVSKEVKRWMKKYPSGLYEEIIKRHNNNKLYIKEKLKISNEKWNNWEWQRRNVIKSTADLEQYVNLTVEEKEAIELANNNGIPFGITPYYLSMLNLKYGIENYNYDSTLRTQAIPKLNCIQKVIEFKNRLNNNTKDECSYFPSEISITRAYPMIAVFKPMHTNTRNQCLYGKKNWEMNYVLGENVPLEMKKIDKAIRWFKKHTEVNEVLITGDIFIFDDNIVEEILSKFADITHIQRIRVSTRMPVILPLRITDSLVHLLSSFQITGRREISLMTHFEHAYEVTLEAMNGIQKLKKSKIHVYNQSTYTVENSRRFEMAALRKELRLIGVDPYYSYNARKDITEERVPIARMIQEQNEESRLAPGIDRDDEAVFNIPGVGKNYLRAFQEHELIMILKDGSRVYEFYPSDVYSLSNKPFIYRDVPIYGFLNQLSTKGENISNYQSIWYYY